MLVLLGLENLALESVLHPTAPGSQPGGYQLGEALSVGEGLETRARLVLAVSH